MSDQNAIKERDDLRMEAAVQTVKDVLFRFEETSEGTRSAYDVFGFIVQDLVNEGLCPACLNEAITAAFSETGADLDKHHDEDGSVYH